MSDVWLTPKWITDSLGPFDLDPCAAPSPRPWDTAKEHYESDGLNKRWNGFVWCNPPFSELESWLMRCAEHRSSIALCFARTETKWFFRTVWDEADCVFFMRGRPTFHRPDGNPGPGNSGAPVVLIGYGREAVRRLSKLEGGKFLKLGS